MEEKVAKCGQNLQDTVAMEEFDQSDPAGQIELVMEHLSQWAKRHLSSAPCRAQPDAQVRRVERWGKKLSDRLKIHYES